MTCSHGSGHRMIANTLKEKYEELGCEVLVFDIFNEYSRLMNVMMEKLYLLSYKPVIDKIYGYLYHSTDKEDGDSLDRFYALFKDIVVNIITGFNPDLIVNTYNHRSVPLFKNTYYPDIPLISVITEYTLPSFWVHDSNDKFYVACDTTKERLENHGISPEKIAVTGIPVRENFERKLDKAELYEKYGLDPNKKTLVIFAGTYGVLKQLERICQGVDQFEGLQTIVVCGLNHKLYKKLTKRDYKNIIIERYINNIEEIYELGDFMVTKPGGTVLSEIVKTKMPVILYDPVPGQELENAMIFSKLKAGIIAKNVNEVLDSINYFLCIPESTELIRKNLEKLDYGNSTELIVRDSLKLIKDS